MLYTNSVDTAQPSMRPPRERQLAYWKTQLDGCHFFLTLPTDRPDPATQLSAAARHSRSIPPDLVALLQDRAHDAQSTPSVVLLAAFCVLLARYSGQNDVVVMTPGCAWTEDTSSDDATSHMLALRASLAGDPSFYELLRRVRDVVLAGYAHGDVPYQEVLEALEAQYDTAPQAGRARVMFAPRRGSTIQAASSQAAASGSNGRAAPGCDLALLIEERDTGLLATIVYNTALFETATIERLAEHFETLLTALLAAPDAPVRQVALLSPSAAARLVRLGQAPPSRPLPAATLPDLFAAQVARTPHAPAVIWDAQSLSYAQLDARANQLAHSLRALGVRPDVPVALCLPRTADLLIAILGTLKAGAAYVPLDPSYPPERLSWLLRDTAAPVLITHTALQPGLPAIAATLLCLDTAADLLAQQPTTPPPSAVTPDHLAYIIYTSGSTGTPKGVAIAQHSVLNAIAWYVEAFGATEVDRGTLVAGLAFDATVWEIWPLLAVGGCLYLPDEATRAVPEQLWQWFDTHAITIAFLPTPMADQVLAANWPPPHALRLLMTGGDQLHQYPAPDAPFRVVNNYGPTENTVVTVAGIVDAADAIYGLPAIGRPIGQTEVYVLDDLLQLVPQGVVGELYCGGAGLARGYWQRPDLTAERFVPHPFSDKTGTRLYRTGDLVRYRADGSLEFLGRRDQQVKIRGSRVEIGEVEAALAELAAVQQAVVVTRQAAGGTELVGYVVPHAGQRLTVAAVRGFAQTRLPAYMVPARLAVVAALPMTTNGKVDRRALAAQVPELVRETTYVAPRSAEEAQVAQIWAEVLQQPQVGVTDNFFDLGGHSLLATRIVAKIADCLDVKLSLAALLAAPTVAELTEHIRAAGSDSKPETLGLLTIRREEHRIQLPLMPGVEDAPAFPASSAQQRLWMLSQLHPESPAYNLAWTMGLNGSLDLAALQQAFDTLIARHESLRTVFPTINGGPVQMIRAPKSIELPLIDLSALAPSAAEAEVQRLAQAEASRIFDLAQGPLLRVLLLRLHTTAHVLVLTMHHIITDGWSMDIWFDEFAQLYQAALTNQPAVLRPLPLHYVEFSLWQRSWLNGPGLKQQMAYWIEQLADAPTMLALPTDRPRPLSATGQGAVHVRDLPSSITAALTTLSQQEQATRFMTLLAAFNVLLARYSGQNDVVVGAPIAGRSQREVEGLIGFFVNTLVLRAKLQPTLTFLELLQQVRATTLSAYAHQDLPFDQLVEVLRPERDSSAHPLFQVAFAMQAAPGSGLKLDGLAATVTAIDLPAAKFDLTLIVEEQGADLTTRWEYSRDVFETATIERLAEHFETLLAALLAAPHQPVRQAALLPPSAAARLVRLGQSPPSRPLPAATLPDLFAAQAARTPHAPAVVWGDQSLSYAQLDARANQLAHHLRALGVRPDVPVALCLPRTGDLLIAILGILKAGAAYVPLDPSYPPERLSWLLRDTAAPVLVTHAALQPGLPATAATLLCLDTAADLLAQQSTTPPPSAVAPDHLAYIIYTSGSTGTPKGVAVAHRGVLNLIAWHLQNFDVTEADRGTLVAGLAFDATVWEIWPLLAVGGCLYLPDEATRAVPEQLWQWFDTHAITIAFLPTPMADQVLAANWPPPHALRLLLTGGDQLHQYPAPDAPFRVVNNYGPTENTVVSTSGAVDTADAIYGLPAIGRPIGQTEVYVLDDLLQLVPQGVVGELYCGGPGLARGYWQRPDLTAERFVPHPFSDKTGTRLYRTGDLVRYRADGSLEFLGRRDQQVKIRGFRIELGEVEAALAEHAAVQQAVVVTRQAAGGTELVGYVVPHAGQRLTAAAVRGFAQARLPAYMVPARLAVVAALPMTTNGKVDRRALAAQVPELVRETTYVAPRSAEEAQVAQIWAEVLQQPQVGVTDNFFDLGGHSLLATRIIARVQEVLQVSIPVSVVFQNPSVAGMATAIQQAQAVDDDDDLW